MKKDLIKIYIDQMVEIKRRFQIIEEFRKKTEANVLSKPETELVYLQFRKILELVALSSLVANKDVYSKAYVNFHKHFHAVLIFKDIEKLNCDFYPKPIYPDKGSRKLIPVPEEKYLSRKEFKSLYEDCGGILHSRNPFRDEIDYNRYNTKISEWCEKIFNLLNRHSIRLINDIHLYYIQMNPIEISPQFNVYKPK